MTTEAGTAPTPRKNKNKPRNDTRRNARCYALQALYQWVVAGQPAAEIEAQFRAEQDMSKTDKALFSELLQGVIANATELDRLYVGFLDRELSELDPIELSVLRIGCFELVHRLSVPYKVAINESVELAKIFGATESHKYVNGILDKLSHQVRAAEVGKNRSGGR